MATLNSITFLGNLTRDPEVRFISNEKAVANFSLASNRKFKGTNGDYVSEVTFVDVEVWGKTAELVGDFTRKGHLVIVQGRLKTDSWDDKDTGAKRSKLKIVATDVQFMTTKAEAEAMAHSSDGVGEASSARRPATRAGGSAAPAARSVPVPVPASLPPDYDEESPF